MPPLAEDSELLRELDGLVAAGRYDDVRARLRALPVAMVESRTRLALLAAEAEGRLGDHVAAARWTHVALALAQNRGERHAELRARNFEGAIALARGAVADAERHFTGALELARLLGDPATEARCLNNLGILANIRGDPDAALARYRLALVAYQHAGFVRGLAETQHNIAISVRDQRDYRRALLAAEEAVRLAWSAGDARLAALAAVGRAELHLLLGDVPLAAAELDRAAATYDNLHFPAGLPEVRRLQAAVARTRGDANAAVRLLREAADLATQYASTDVLADIERDLAATLEASRDHAGARAARERASALYRRLGATRAADDLLPL
ncbi:MAG: tetratricopeptide repeat protein [Gemmatimonadales bacterium]